MSEQRVDGGEEREAERVEHRKDHEDPGREVPGPERGQPDEAGKSTTHNTAPTPRTRLTKGAGANSRARTDPYRRREPAPRRTERPRQREFGRGRLGCRTGPDAPGEIRAWMAKDAESEAHERRPRRTARMIAPPSDRGGPLEGIAAQPVDENRVRADACGDQTGDRRRPACDRAPSARHPPGDPGECRQHHDPADPRCRGEPSPAHAAEPSTAVFGNHGKP